MGDLDLWAWYCRHFNRNAIVEKAHEYASMQRQGEVRDAVTAFQAWLSSEFKVKAPKHLNARPCRPDECPNFEEGGPA